MNRCLAVLLAAICSMEGVLAHGAVHDRLAVVERQLAESPDDASLLLQRAALFHEHGDHGKALEDLRMVGRIDPDRAGRWLLEARIHSDCGAPEEALAAVQGLLKQEPKSIEGLSLRGQILETLGRNQEAIRDAREVIKRSPEPKLQHHMQLIRLLEPHGDRAEVAAAFSAARKSLGNIPVLLQRQAGWLAATGDRERAAVVYAELRREVPGLAFTLHVAEARLWAGHDENRARLSRDAAERAWASLPPAVRSREAMRAMYRELERLGDSITR